MRKVIKAFVSIVLVISMLLGSAVAIAAAVFLWAAPLKNKKLVRWHGIVLLLGYAAYFVYLIMMP